ncbi:MAG: glycerol kinase GlpK [Rubricoccaceae bacterium]|nr:glycerol kinase GlpK [Rubricoccaceae bacterium]
MSATYLLSIDQGTTSCRALLFDAVGRIVGIEQQEFPQHYPDDGWVEHDAEQIRDIQFDLTSKVVESSGVDTGNIAGIGITNQRETTVVWNRKTGKPIHNALVWQDRRTVNICEELIDMGLEDHIRRTTGLRPDPYFSATKIAWILRHVSGAREAAERGDLAFGTIDSWLLWNLTGGPNGGIHATDVTNASRTMLFDIHKRVWDDRLLESLGIPDSMLPEVKPSSGHFGITTNDSVGLVLPVLGVAGDQHAALFGQTCFEAGMAKNTYGTGCFMLMQTGSTPVASENGLLTTVAWDTGSGLEYALEGSVFIAGAAIQWLRDELGLLERSSESETLATSVTDNGGVYVVPAFAGLGAPYWEPNARGAVFGLTRASSKAHVVRATLESLAYQTKDVLDAMSTDAGLTLSALRVDGGAAENNFLMQFQADMLNTPVERPKVLEATAWGAAALAGLAADIFDKSELASRWRVDATFEPTMVEDTRARLYTGWERAVQATLGWATT